MAERCDAVIWCARDVLASKYEGTVILLDLKNGIYYRLNEVGAVVWKAVSERACSLEDIVACVVAEYEISRKVVGEDIREFVDSLCKIGLCRMHAVERKG